jgi:ribosomal protein S1
VAAITVVNLDTWLGIAAAVEAVEEVVVGTVEAVEEVAAAVEAATTVESLVTLPEIAQPVLVRSLCALLFMSKVWVI